MGAWNAIAVFCEDIRQEKDQHTLIGVLPDNVNVPHIPGTFPRLGIYIRIHADPKADLGEIKSRIQYADGKSQDLSSFEAAFVKKTQQDTLAKGGPFSGFVIHAVATNFSVTTAGRASVFIKIAGEEILCGTLNIQLVATANPSPIAAAPPASQSPPAS